MRLSRIFPLIILLICAVLAACSTTGKDWRQTQETDTSAAYRSFAAKHEGTPQAETAQQIVAVRETAAWKSTVSESTRAAYEDYWSAFGSTEGLHSAQAKAFLDTTIGRIVVQKVSNRSVGSNSISVAEQVIEGIGSSRSGIQYYIGEPSTCEPATGGKTRCRYDGIHFLTYDEYNDPTSTNPSKNPRTLSILYDNKSKVVHINIIE